MVRSSSACKFSSTALAFPLRSLRASLLLARDLGGHRCARPPSSPGAATLAYTRAAMLFLHCCALLKGLESPGLVLMEEECM